MTRITTVKSEPTQVGPGQSIAIKTSAVHLMSHYDLKALLQLMGEGYELKGTFMWRDYTIAIIQTVLPTKQPGLTINNRRK